MGRCRRHGCEGCSRRATGKRRPDKHVVHPVPVQAFGHRGDLNVRHRNARVGVSPGATPMAPLSLGGGLSAEFSCHLGRRPGRRPLFASHSLTASRWVSGGSRRIRNSKPAASWPALVELPMVLTERPDPTRCAGYRGLQVPRSPIPLRSHGVLARSRSGTTSPLLDPPSVLRSSTRRLVDI